MMNRCEVEKFVAYWQTQVGSERSRCHQFWDSLLGEVLGVADVKRFIEYEKPVYFNDGTTKSLDDGGDKPHPLEEFHALAAHRLRAHRRGQRASH